MRDLTELIMTDYGKLVSRQKPTQAEISFVESLVGTKLPVAYVSFLTFSNGGCPELNAFTVELEGRQHDWEVNVFFHIGPDVNATENVVWNYRHLWPGAKRAFLPIAVDGTGNPICLDLSEHGEQRAILWIHDMPDRPPVRVADSFGEFIDMLKEPPGYA
jgi:cell wall assembly regulator SMI1